MDLLLHEGGQGCIDQAMALDARQAGESGRNDGELIVTPAGRGAGVPGVARRIVDDFQRLRSERVEAVFDLFYRAQFGPLSSMNRDNTTACPRTKTSIKPVAPNILKLTHASVEKL